MRSCQTALRQRISPPAPTLFSLNEAGIDPNLVGVGVLLISRIGRYPPIGGDSNFADFLPGDGRDEFDLRHQQNPLSG